MHFITGLCAVSAVGLAADGEFPAFKEHVINAEAGTGLAITAADIDADGDMDIVAVSSDDVIWYENPEWTAHLITPTLKGSNVAVAPHDLDGDGTPELALGADWQFNNTKGGGALYLLRARGDVREPWKAITLVEEEPTLHRIRWADVEADGKMELVVAPLKGRNSMGPNFQETGVDLYLLRPGDDPFATPWERETIDRSLHVLHNVWPMENSPRGVDAILAASFEGLVMFEKIGGEWQKTTLAAGNPEPLPNSGAGEIKSSIAGNRLFATIEPWHGHQAVIYAENTDDLAWERFVIDDALAGGHAVWWADFDRDGWDELLVGWREKAGPEEKPGLNIYDLTLDYRHGEPSLTAEKHVIDDGGMATEDAMAVDINGDGWKDVIAFGRATRNVKYYENLGR